MNKASLIASAALVGIVLAAAPAARAQGPFADVPSDHWAYQAVDKLQKAGIVIGYPDQTYGGKRSMTRYEFAIALWRALKQVQAVPGPKGDTGDKGEPGPAGPPGMTPELESVAPESTSVTSPSRPLTVPPTSGMPPSGSAAPGMPAVTSVRRLPSVSVVFSR